MTRSHTTCNNGVRLKEQYQTKSCIGHRNNLVHFYMTSSKHGLRLEHSDSDYILAVARSRLLEIEYHSKFTFRQIVLMREMDGMK